MSDPLQYSVGSCTPANGGAARRRVLSGEIRLGAHVVGPGDTLAIEGKQRYGFRSDHGFTFINYRSDASQHTGADGSPPRMEGGLVNGMKPPGTNIVSHSRS